VNQPLGQDPYYGVFVTRGASLDRHPQPPASLPDPGTGHALKIATVDVGGPAICPACESRGKGGFISFIADPRLVYACPACRKLVWIHGA
jgi:hypothetical protein